MVSSMSGASHFQSCSCTNRNAGLGSAEVAGEGLHGFSESLLKGLGGLWLDLGSLQGGVYGVA